MSRTNRWTRLLLWTAPLVAMGCSLEGPPREERETVGVAAQGAICTTFVRPNTSVADATIIQDPSDPSRAVSNLGALTTLLVGPSGTAQRQALLRFDLGAKVPAGSSVQSATLTLRKALGVGPTVLSLHDVTAAWSELGVTHSSFNGAYAPSASTTFDLGTIANGANAAIDVTALAQGWVTSGTNHGLLLDIPTGGRVTLGASDASSILSRPRLTLCFVPPAPTCSDGVMNGQETGVDCGGSCPACPDPCAGVVCAPLDACHVAGACDPATGLCSQPAAPDGAPCSDGDACTQSDTCQSGVCTGGSPVVCAALDACHTVGSCDPQTGLCAHPTAPDGAPCSDGDACTQSDTCQSGACTGGSPVVCAAVDACHAAGSCDPQTGLCSNPPAPCCADGQQNQGESGVDCGGPCAPCVVSALLIAEGAAGTPGDLLTFDPLSNTVSPIGPLGVAITGMTTAPDGTLYGTTASQYTFGELVTIDRATGAAASLAALADASGTGHPALADLEMLGDNLLGWTETGDQVAYIDRGTGLVTARGAGLSSFGSGLAVAADGTLYLAPEGLTGSLRTLDTNGNAVGTVQLDGTSSVVRAMAFLDGTLYAIGSDWGAVSELVTIDPISGHVTHLVTLPGGAEALAPSTYQGPPPGTCADGAQNQGETGVDCGGPCGPCDTATLLVAEGTAGNPGTLYVVDEQTAAAFPIGAIGVGVTGMTITASGGLFATTSSLYSLGELVSLDPSTGAASTVGPLDDANLGWNHAAIADLTSFGDLLLGWTNQGQHAVVIDADTGAVRALGGGVYTTAPALAAGPDRRIYVATGGLSGGLIQLDVTGEPVSAVVLDGDLPVLRAMTFHAGALYAIASDWVSTTVLVRIDPSSGHVTTVGPLPLSSEAITTVAYEGPPAGSCGDGLENQLETAVDCGGTCAPCPPPCPAVDLEDLTGPTVAVATTVGGVDAQVGSCGGGGAPDATFGFTAPAAGRYRFSTLGSAMDSVLYVRDGACDGPELGCDDDALAVVQSELTLELAAGQAVVVVVDGAGGAAGDFQLAIEPALDGACEAPIQLGSTLGAAVATGQLDGQGNDAFGPCTGSFGEDVAFLWTAPATGTFQLDTLGSPSDTGLYVRDGSCNGVVLGCNEDFAGSPGASLTLDLVAGQSIEIVVDAAAGAGSFALGIHALTPLACDGGAPLGAALGPALTAGTTEGGVDHTFASCGGAGAPDASFTWTAPATGSYTIDTLGSALDTVLSVRDGSCAGPELACSDDAAGTAGSSVTVSLTAGQSIVIVIDGYAYAGGFVLGIQPAPGPSCDPGTSLGSATGQLASGTTLGGGADSLASCGGVGEEVVYTWTAPASGVYRFDTLGSSTDTVLAIRDGSCAGAELACNDDTAGGSASSITLSLALGQSVVLLVDSYALAGPFVLHATEVSSVLSGLVFVDSDGDGAVATDDLRLSAAHLDLATDTDCDGVGEALLATTATDGTGTFALESIPAGCVVLDVDEASLPAGVTGPAVAPRPLAISVGAVLSGLDFGYLAAPVPPPPPVSRQMPPALAASLPQTPAGLPVVAQAPLDFSPTDTLRISYDEAKDDAITRWAECLSRVTGCYAVNLGSVTACIDMIPLCPDDTGGPACCPPSCLSAYHTQLATGLSEKDAVLQSFAEGSCVSGFAAQRDASTSTLIAAGVLQ